MNGKYERLRKEGLVVSGNYGDVKAVSISQGGESHPLAVNPLVLPEEEVTVFRPLGTQRQSSDAFDDPRYVQTIAEIEGAREPWRLFMPKTTPQALETGVEVVPSQTF